MKPGYSKDIKYATLIRFGMCGSPDCRQIHVDLMDDNFKVFATALADKNVCPTAPPAVEPCHLRGFCPPVE